MATFTEVMENAPKGFEDMEQEAQAYWDNSPDYWGGEDTAEFWDKFTEAYSGVWDSERDFAEQLAEDVGMVTSDDSARYFDYEAFENDLFMGDYWSARIAGGVVVFRSY